MKDREKFDAHGQPLLRFPANLLTNYGKAADQLIGICRGILFDGDVSEAEAVGLRRFVDTVCASGPEQFPFGLLRARLDKIFADGAVSADEREELKGIVLDLAGLTAESVTEEATTTRILPFDQIRDLTFTDMNFVITGRFSYGTRSKVESAISLQGGICMASVTKETHFLVVGHFASRDWLHTNWGNKIERAIELRQELGILRILTEEDFARALIQ
jgi:hypothetical protein